MKHCLDCTYKHLAQAMIIHEEECPNGYPDHIHRVVGHLAEASREIVAYHPVLAMEIRSHRVRIMGDPQYMPPYEGLLDYVSELIAADAQQLPKPAIPVEILAHPEEYEDTQIAVPTIPGTRVDIVLDPVPPPYQQQIVPSESPF